MNQLTIKKEFRNIDGTFKKGHSFRVGMKHSPETLEKFKISNRRIITDEHRKKISESLKGLIRPPRTLEHRHNLSLSRKGIGHPCTYQTRLRLSESRRGEKGSNWKGGVSSVSSLIRKSLQYKEWRLSVFKRDNFKCVNCGNSKGGELNADHIIPFSKILQDIIFKHGIEKLFESALKCKLLWNISNGRTLCISCHKNTNTWGCNLLKKNHV